MLVKLADFKSKFSRKISAVLVVASLALMSCLNVFAADESSVASSDMTSVLTSSFTSMQSDIFSYVQVVLPIALGIFALFFCTRKAIQFFKSFSK